MFSVSRLLRRLVYLLNHLLYFLPVIFFSKIEIFVEARVSQTISHNFPCLKHLKIIAYFFKNSNTSTIISNVPLTVPKISFFTLPYNSRIYEFNLVVAAFLVIYYYFPLLIIVTRLTIIAERAIYIII